MNRADTARLDDLRARAELAELEIEMLLPKDFAAVDPESMTIGQMIVVADYFRAVRVIKDEADRLASKKYSPQVERRGDTLTDVTVQTVNGPMKWADVPRNEYGTVPEHWFDANCVCDEHEQGRIDADKRKTADDSIARGLYL